jgi:ATP-binding cassette subfamily F protein 3
MISIDYLSKSFGDRVLLDKVSVRINSRERVGLVGRNGHGKTTLLRMITGEDQPDEGSVVIPKNYRMGHVQQHLAFSRPTVLEEGMQGLPQAEKDHHWKVEKILAGLGFTPADMQRHPDEFSGGFQVRLNLAKVLVSEPDLLLLDEPTNYLDITSIRWITQFLRNWPHEVLLITHDRGFMDGLVTHVAGIHRQKIRKIKGDTQKYYMQLAQEEEIYEKTRVNDEKKRKETELFISRFRAKARLANMVQSRIKTLEKMEKKEKLASVQTLGFSFKNHPFPAKHVMSTEKVEFGYSPDVPRVIHDLTFSVNKGDQICVIGKNGKGKTTLLKLIAGLLNPAAGKITYNPNVVKGFFEQTNIQTLVDSYTVEEEILGAHPGTDRQLARNICGAMMFPGDDALKKISVLSGGEKSRVMLGKLLVTPANLLLLDEPSNHLDMESCDAMLAAIDNFEGAVIMVTHNEMFLHAIAQRLIVFQDDAIDVFEGSYREFLDNDGWACEDTAPGPEATARDTGDRPAISRKELKRKRSQIINAKSRALNPLRKRIEKVEDAIERDENSLAELNNRMIEVSRQKDGKKIGKLSRAIHECQEEIDRCYAGLESLSQEFDSLEAEFEQQLNNLDAVNK